MLTDTRSLHSLISPHCLSSAQALCGIEGPHIDGCTGKGPTLGGKQVAGLDVERGALVPGVQQQVQQQQVALAPREARAVGLRQPDIPQRQCQDAQRRPVVPQLRAGPAIRACCACMKSQGLDARGCLISASAEHHRQGRRRSASLVCR